jgi:hypothetical protein
MDASVAFTEVMGRYDEAAGGKRLAAYERFDRVVEAKLPALRKEAPELPDILDTTRDVLEGYLGRVEALVESDLTGDPYDIGSDLSAKVVYEGEFKLRRKLPSWARYVLDSLGSFRSDLKAPGAVKPPLWRIDQDRLKLLLASRPSGLDASPSKNPVSQPQSAAKSSRT